MRRVSLLQMMDEEEFSDAKNSHLGPSTSVDRVLEGSVVLYNQCPTNQKTGGSKSQLHFSVLMKISECRTFP